MHIQKAYKGRFCQLVVQVLYIPFVATLICSRLYVASLYGTVCSYIDMQLASKLAAKNIHLNFEFHKPFLVGLFSLNFAATSFVQILLFLYICRNLMHICCSQLAAFIILSYKILICIAGQLATVFLFISKYKIYIYTNLVLCVICVGIFFVYYIQLASQLASQLGSQFLYNFFGKGKLLPVLFLPYINNFRKNLFLKYIWSFQPKQIHQIHVKLEISKSLKYSPFDNFIENRKFQKFQLH